MVVDLIIYHPTLRKLIKYLESTSGREKTLRLIQYLVRFLSFYGIKRGFSIELIKLFKSLQNQATFIRKTLRFLKPLNHLIDASKAYDNKLADAVIRTTLISKNLAYVGYLSLDSITWLKLLGLISSKSFIKVPKYANWFWFFGLISGLINDLRKLSISSSKLINSTIEENKDNIQIKSLQIEKEKALKKLVWDSLDFFIVLNNLKFLNFNEGLIGLAGTLTSLFGIQDIWGNTKI